ncbi:hypothetical protein [Dactylosporangium salmoneum]|uniref:Uncharacterized protein n=1 Tax=Dactylosporangium salmoneum TaxID=53361 RepID=A0ABN3G943_9ACTN
MPDPTPPERSQFTPTDDAEGMLQDVIDWGRLADIDAARRILLRFAATDPAGHLPLTAEQAATLVVDAIAEQIHARGIAEGRRLRADEIDALTRGAYADGLGDGHSQATEGWEREWGTVGDGWAYPARSEKAARDVTRYSQGGATVSRLVGPWEPAEQPQPARAIGCTCPPNMPQHSYQPGCPSCEAFVAGLKPQRMEEPDQYGEPEA